MRYRMGETDSVRAKRVETRRCLDCAAQVTGNALRCRPCGWDHMDRKQREGKRRREKDRRGG